MDAIDADITPQPKRPRLDPTSDEPTLEALRIQESKVRHALEQAESLAHRLRMKLKEIKDKINHHNVPPFKNFPLELLTMIFGFLVAISPDEIFRVYSVCQLWRTVSLELPALWSTIIVSRDNHAFMQKIKLCGERSFCRKRSQTEPLKVSYTQSIELGRLPRRWHAWKELMSISPRFTSFAATFDDCRSASDKIPEIAGCSSLQELSVSIRYQNQDQGHEGKFGFEKFHVEMTPSLRSLTISTHILPKTPSLLFAKLTRLQVTDTFHRFERPMNLIEPIRGKHILDVLRFCPNLEDFSFDGETSSGRVPRRDLTPAIQDVRLLKLRSLRLICHYTVAFTVLSRIVAPNVEDAVLRIFPRDRFQEDEPSVTAGKFMARCPKIRTLWLYGLNHNVLFGTSSGLQLLEKLHLEYVAGLNIIAKNLWMVPPSASYAFWFIPRLSSVSIVANWWDVPFDEFAKVIKVRYGTNNQRTSSVPARIQKYVVNDQNLLAAEGEVAEYSTPNRFPWNPGYRTAGVRGLIHGMYCTAGAYMLESKRRHGGVTHSVRLRH
ncbi:hypothetical protein JB92DRAFT_3094810 [Gautieria morchelliformis]|nr:hypothetical protein JB92DRAFT_3094810 [Gautieria morchelliformis]